MPTQSGNSFSFASRFFCGAGRLTCGELSNCSHYASAAGASRVLPLIPRAFIAASVAF